MMKTKTLLFAFSALGLSLTACNPREGSGITNSWSTLEAGNYLVVYDQLGSKKGQVTYIGNGTVSYSERDQDIYQLTGRVQTVVFTKENQGQGGAEDQSVPISAQGVNGRADIEIKFQFKPTQDSMGAFVKQYKKTFPEFHSSELRSAVQTCAISASDKLSAFDFQKPFENNLVKCLENSFDSVGVKIDFFSARLTGVPNFGDSFAKSRAAIAEKKAAITALDLEKERRDKEAAIEKTIDDKTFERILAKKKLEIQETLAEKGINSFPLTTGVSAVTGK
jgi:hypothetical protein